MQLKSKIELKYREMRECLAPKSQDGGEMPPETFKNIVDVVEIVKPKNILEIGFSRGNSALMWLLASDANLHSIDIYANKDNHAYKGTEQEIDDIILYRKSVHFPDAMISIEYIISQFPERFTFELLNSITGLPEKKNEWYKKFDLIFIDADHSAGPVIRDTENSINLGPDYILYDDYKYNWVESIIRGNERLEIVKVYPIIEEGDSSSGQCLTKVVPSWRDHGK